MTPADIYDLLNAWDSSDDFYLGLVMGAHTVVDVGCGTGSLLSRARADGHGGQLVGVDPDPDMLAVARNASGAVEWVQATAAEIGALGMDLAVMTGHAFQTLVTDDDIVASLRAIRGALNPGGRFAFETRNPGAEPWLRWGGETSVSSPLGRSVTVSRHVREVTADVVTFDETFTGTVFPDSVTVTSTLRFLSVGEVVSLLGNAGFAVAEQFGDWDRSPVIESSPEIVTIAIRA